MPETRRLTRREAIRKGAVVGGHLLWIAPAIQTLAPKAYAHVASGTNTCCQCVRSPGQGRVFLGVATAGDCASLCLAEENPSGWVFGGFHVDSTPFTSSGDNSGNANFCENPDHDFSIP